MRSNLPQTTSPATSITIREDLVPTLVAAAGPQAAMRCVEFFAATKTPPPPATPTPGGPTTGLWLASAPSVRNRGSRTCSASCRCTWPPTSSSCSTSSPVPLDELGATFL